MDAARQPQAASRRRGDALRCPSDAGLRWCRPRRRYDGGAQNNGAIESSLHVGTMASIFSTNMLLARTKLLDGAAPRRFRPCS